jgi:hypothetical protein
MMLARRDVEPQFVAQQVFVEGFVEQPRRDLGVAIAVGQAGAPNPPRPGPRQARTGRGFRNETKRP